MKPKENNFAYIDGANLHKGIKSLGWKLDYRVFRRWLEQKYNIEEAYLFIGLVPKHKDLYTFLQKCGYILVYKEVTYDGDGKVKGNCDADLALNVYLSMLQGKLAIRGLPAPRASRQAGQKEKAPGTDESAQGSLS